MNFPYFAPLQIADIDFVRFFSNAIWKAGLKTVDTNGDKMLKYS